MMEFQRLPVLPKFVELPTFDPRYDCPVSFISNYDKITDRNGWDCAYKIRYLQCYLKHASVFWFQKYATNKDNLQKTWPDLKKDFISNFGGDITIRKLKSKLRSRKQDANEDIKHYYFDLLSMFQEIYDEINFEQFRDYFENGLHPSYDKYYFMLSSRDMDFTALNNIVYKLSDLKDRLTDYNTLAHSSHFYEDKTSINNSASENKYEYSNYVQHSDYLNSNKRNKRQVEDDYSYNGHRVEDIDNVRGKSGHENKNYRYNNTDEYNFNTNYERRQQKLIEDNRTKSFEQNPPLS
ncbi:uncharacterized protein LOC115874222 [Sitophilus oryzae]|uniref:Uncharacterized protein LOC115874222 n=1 Tax=Sitophilus oryzae TaxID=7048 RepID=A0A6J2X212_SITOR|nr:uncharacterized protein LOC115874222 [Sitophilus oryzae]